MNYYWKVHFTFNSLLNLDISSDRIIRLYSSNFLNFYQKDNLELKESIYIDENCEVELNNNKKFHLIANNKKYTFNVKYYF